MALVLTWEELSSSSQLQEATPHPSSVFEAAKAGTAARLISSPKTNAQTNRPLNLFMVFSSYINVQ